MANTPIWALENSQLLLKKGPLCSTNRPIPIHPYSQMGNMAAHDLPDLSSCPTASWSDLGEVYQHQRLLLSSAPQYSLVQCPQLSCCIGDKAWWGSPCPCPRPCPDLQAPGWVPSFGSVAPESELPIVFSDKIGSATYGLQGHHHGMCTFANTTCSVHTCFGRMTLELGGGADLSGIDSSKFQNAKSTFVPLPLSNFQKNFQVRLSKQWTPTGILVQVLGSQGQRGGTLWMLLTPLFQHPREGKGQLGRWWLHPSPLQLSTMLAMSKWVQVLILSPALLLSHEPVHMQ